jgi:pimeloyl-ACP methyl ester carboxylesterase
MLDIFKSAKNFIENQFQKNGFSNKTIDIDDYEIQFWDNHKTECPILLIWGEKDDIIPLKIAHQLKGYFDDCSLFVIPRTKHLPNLERPKLCNNAIIAFLKQ